MTFTSSDLDNLKAALLSGALEVTIGDRTVKYRSQADLIKAIKIVEAYLNGVPTSADDNPSVIKGSYKRGGQ